jgi:Tol biopolymer transport system component
VKVPGTEGAGRLFWSPDSKSIAFFAAGQLKRVDVAGGSPQNICETPDLRGGAWNAAGVIVFASSAGLQRVLAAGGRPQPLPAAPEKGNPREPLFLPDGRRFLYLSGAEKDAAIYAGQLDSTEAVKLLDADSNASVVVDPGYLLYHRQGTLYAHPFNPSGAALHGEPIRIADGIPYGDLGAGAFSASQTGILIYRSTPPAATGPATQPTSFLMPNPLVWVDRSGKLIRTLAPMAAWTGPDLSPDEQRIALHRHDSDGGDIHIFEPGLELPVKFTFDAGQDSTSPVWSPDGKRIAFGSRRSGKWGLYLKLADNTGGEELLQESDGPVVPTSWHEDALVYMTSSPKTNRDLWYVRMTEGNKEPVAFLQTAADERHAQLSADGKWIAYSSNTTGRSEIYIRPFPQGPGLVQISTNGGVFPRWRHDQKELYFMSLVSVGAMMAVDISVRGSEIRKDADAHGLFQTGFINGTHAGGYSHAYAVSRDGQRFLLPQADVSPGGFRGMEPIFIVPMLAGIQSDRRGSFQPARSTAPINVVLNWTATLKR